MTLNLEPLTNLMILLLSFQFLQYIASYCVIPFCKRIHAKDMLLNVDYLSMYRYNDLVSKIRSTAINSRKLPPTYPSLCPVTV